MKKSLCIALSVLLGVGLCMGAFSLSAFAAVDPAFSVDYCSSITPAIYEATPILINSNGYLTSIFTTDAHASIVYCPWNNGSPNNNVGTAHCIVMSLDPNAILYSIRFRSDGQIYSNASLRSLSLTYVSDGVTYYYYSFEGNSGEYCYPIDSMPRNVGQALAACVSALNYSPAPDPTPSPSLNDGGTNLSGMSSTNYSFVVPAGYLAVIEYQSDLVVHIQQSFDSFSTVLPNAGDYFPNSTGWYAFSDSLPSSGQSYQFYGGPGILKVPYERAGSLTAVLKQAKIGSSVIRSNYVSDYFYLCNPSVTFYSDHGEMQLNHDMVCTVNHCDSIRLYPISTAVYTYQVNYLTCTVSGYPYFYTVSGLLRDPTEESNLSSVSVPSSDDDEAAVYTHLLSNIDQFFSKGWNAVRSVLDSLGQFPQFFTTLLSALPSDITTIIAGFVGILCCIGVIKALI